jgi:hypothetical protein
MIAVLSDYYCRSLQLVDTLGLLIAVKVVAADVPERDGAKQLFEQLNQERHRVPHLTRIWAARFGGKLPPKTCLVDGGFSGVDFLHFVMDTFRWILDVVLRPDGSKGFILLPKRWTVVGVACRRLTDLRLASLVVVSI